MSPKWPRQRDPGSSQQGLHSLSTMFFILFHRMNRKGNVSMLNAAVLSILDGLVSRIHCLLHLKCLSSGRRNESCRFAKHNKQTSIVGSRARLWSILLFSITMTALGRKQTKVFHDLRHACLVTPWTTCMLILCRMQGYSITMLPGHPSPQKQYRQTIPMQHHCHIFFCTSCCF